MKCWHGFSKKSRKTVSIQTLNTFLNLRIVPCILKRLLGDLRSVHWQLVTFKVEHSPLHLFCNFAFTHIFYIPTLYFLNIFISEHFWIGVTKSPFKCGKPHITFKKDAQKLKRNTFFSVGNVTLWMSVSIRIQFLEFSWFIFSTVIKLILASLKWK